MLAPTAINLTFGATSLRYAIFSVSHRLRACLQAQSELVSNPNTNFTIHFIDSVNALTGYIDNAHLLVNFGGSLSFNANQWFETRQTIDRITATLARIQTTPQLDNDLVVSSPAANQLTSPTNQRQDEIANLERDAMELRNHLKTPYYYIDDCCGGNVNDDCPSPDRLLHISQLDWLLAELETLKPKSPRIDLEIVQRIGDKYQQHISTLRRWTTLVDAVQDYLPSSSLPTNVNDPARSPTSDNLLVVQQDLESSAGADLAGLSVLHERVGEACEEASRLTQQELRSLRDEAVELLALTGNGPANESSAEDPDGADARLRGRPISPRLPPETVHWPRLFDRLIQMADTTLPQIEQQLGIIVDLNSVVEEARTWLLSAQTLIDDLEPEKLTLKSLDECRLYSLDLNALLATHQSQLASLINPSLFRSRFGSSAPTETFKLAELLCDLEQAVKSCGHLRASLLRHISQLSYSQRPLSHSVAATARRSQFAAAKSANKAPMSFDEGPSLVKAAAGSGGLPTSKTCSNLSLDASSSSQPDKYQLAWNELIDTERVFVDFLQHVHDVFWPSKANQPDPNIPAFMYQLPTHLLPCWPDLLTFHRNSFLASLLPCSGDGFKLEQWANRMLPQLVDLYSSYCRLHPTACQLASQLERHRQFADWVNACSRQVHEREVAAASPLPNKSRSWLPLSTRLITPIQRFQRYHLLIGHLLHLTRSEVDRAPLDRTHRMFMDLCELINVVMHLRDLSLRPSELGRLLLQADFALVYDGVTSASGSPKQRHAFLFSNTLLLTKRTNATSSASSTASSKLTMFADVNSTTQSSFSVVLPFVRFGSGGTSRNSSSITSSGPYFKVKQQLMLNKIGLTPSLQPDGHRLVLWTANGAKTLTLINQDAKVINKWIHAINDLLTDRLVRFRDDRSSLRRPADQQQKSATFESSSSIGGNGDLLRLRPADRSSSLPPV